MGLAIFRATKGVGRAQVHRVGLVGRSVELTKDEGFLGKWFSTTSSNRIVLWGVPERVALLFDRT